MRFVRAPFATLPATIVLALLLAGCGGHQTTTASPTRTVDVTMVDNAFQPATVVVGKGEAVRFRFKNAGTVRHEGVIGDDAFQERHHRDMAASTGTAMTPAPAGGMDHGHAPSQEATVTVEPGTTAQLDHTFTEGGTITIGCHEPGHWEAGMKATVTVT